MSIYKTLKESYSVHANLQHGLQVVGDLEGSIGLGLDLVDGDTVGDLNKSQAAGSVNVEDTELGDDTADAGRASERELAGLDNLGVTLLVGVLHGHDDPGGGGVGDQVHGTAEALNLTGDHPCEKMLVICINEGIAGKRTVGQVTLGADLHGTKDGHVDTTGADHSEGLVTAEAAGTGLESDSLLAGVDDIGILLTLLGVRAETENTVLGLQDNLDGGVDEVGSKDGHTNTEVGVHAVLELLSGTADNTLALVGGLTLTKSSGVSTLLLGVGVLLNLRGESALDDTLDVDTGQVDGSGINLAGLDDVLSLNDGHLGVTAHGAVEVVGCVAEQAVTKSVGLPCLDESVVSLDCLLHDVALAIKHLGVAGLAVLCDCAVGVVSQGHLTELHHGTKGGRCVECGDTRTTGTAALSESSLGAELQVDLTSDIHSLEGLVLTNVRSNHLRDLLGLEEQTETSSVNTSVVTDHSQVIDRGVLQDSVNQRVRHTTQPESTSEQSRARLHVLDCRLGGGVHLVNITAADTARECAGNETLVLVKGKTLSVSTTQKEL